MLNGVSDSEWDDKMRLKVWDFQDLMQAVVESDAKKLHFNPTSPNIGGDDGYDGFSTQGTYRRIKGHHSFQAKTCDKQYDDAEKILKKALKSDLVKAEKNKVDVLHFFTNAKLKPKHVKALEEMGANQSIKTFIYDRAKINPLLDKHPLVKFNFFKIPQQISFKSRQEYYGEKRIEDIRNIKQPFVGRQLKISQMASLIEQNDAGVILLLGDSNEGKSRFIYELSKYIQINKKIIPLHIANSLKFKDDFQRLDLNEEYVGILDDANVHISDRNHPLIHHLYSAETPVMVFTGRVNESDEIQEFLKNKKINLIETIYLETLSDDELGQIFTDITEIELSDQQRRDFFNVYGKLPGDIVRQAFHIKEKTKPEAVKKNIIDSLYKQEEFFEGFESREQYSFFLSHIAMMVPFSKKLESNTKKHLQSFFPLVDVEAVLINLKKRKILRYVGDTIRFQADISGDIQLGEYIANEEDPSVPLGVISSLREFGFGKNLYKNLWSVYVQNGSENLRYIVISLFKSVDRNSLFVKDKDLIQILSPIAPKITCGLISDYVSDESLATTVTTDEVMPAIIKIFHTLGPLEYLMDLVFEIAATVKEGSYSNYHIEDFFKECVSPISRFEKNQVKNALVRITSDPLSTEKRKFILPSIQEVLQLEFNKISASGITITNQNYVLNSLESVADLRKIATNSLKLIFDSGGTELLKGALELVSHLRIPQGDRPLSFQKDVATEIVSILEHLEIDRFKELSLLNNYENTFLTLWALHNDEEVAKPLLSLCEQRLKGIERSPCHVISSLYDTQDKFFVQDFEELQGNIDHEDKWGWMWHNASIYYVDKNIKSIVVKILQDIKDEDDLRQALSCTNGERIGGFPHIPLLEEMYLSDPDLIDSLISKYREDLPSSFQKSIDSIEMQKEPQVFGELIIELFDKEEWSEDDVRRFVDLLFSKNQINVVQLNEVLISFLDREYQFGFVRHVSRFLYHFYDKAGSYQGSEKVISKILKVYKDNEESYENTLDLFFSTIFEKNSYSERQIEYLKDDLESYLMRQAEFKYTERIIIRGVYDNLPDLLQFIKKKTSQSPNPYSFTTFFSGAEKIFSEYVNSYEEFKVMLSELSVWEQEGLISKYELKNMFRGLKDVEVYIKKHLLAADEEQLDSDGYLLSHVQQDQERLEFHLELLKRLVEHDLFSGLKDYYVEPIFSFASTRKVGEDSKYLRKKIEFINDVLKEVQDVEVQNYFKAIKKDIQTMITNERKRDDEYLNEKG